MDTLFKLTGALVNVSRKQILITELGTVEQKCPNGTGLRALSSFLRVVFSSSAPHLRDRVNRCYKIYIEREQEKQTVVDGSANIEKPHPKAKIINVWCFSAAFGYQVYLYLLIYNNSYLYKYKLHDKLRFFFRIQFLLKQNIRSIIFTSGTLAPLKPLTIEMDIQNSIQLINPHIVKPSQVAVKVVGYGPDDVLLESSFRNR